MHKDNFNRIVSILKSEGEITLANILVESAISEKELKEERKIEVVLHSILRNGNYAKIYFDEGKVIKSRRYSTTKKGIKLKNNLYLYTDISKIEERKPSNDKLLRRFIINL